MPAYPSVRLGDVILFVLFLTSPPSSDSLSTSDPKLATKLCHTQPPFALPVVGNYRFQEDKDPSDLVHIMNFGITPQLLDCINRQNAPLYFSLADTGSCFTTTTTTTTVAPPLILDTGASVCITPLKTDFTTNHSSEMKIKDLSSSNTVAGEGLLCWNVVDIDGNHTELILPGYHIPTAEVRLLSPQLLLTQHGGYVHQTSNVIQLCLDSGECIDASYCMRKLCHTEGVLGVSSV